MDRRINLLAQLITEDPNTNKSHLYKRAILAERRLLREAPTPAAASAPAKPAAQPAAAAPAAQPAAPAAQPAAPAAQPAAAAAPQAQLSSSQKAFLDREIAQMYAGYDVEQRRKLLDPKFQAEIRRRYANGSPNQLNTISKLIEMAQADPALKTPAAAPTATAATSITGVAARKPIPNDVKVAQPLLITLQKAIPALKKINFQDANAAAQWYAANGGGQGIVNLLKQPANARALGNALMKRQIG